MLKPQKEASTSANNWMGGNSENWKVDHSKLACTGTLSGRELAGHNLAEITCLNVSTIPKR